MTTRRDVLALGACVLSAPLASFAQQNLRTGRALGLTIPSSVIARADRVIE